MKEVKCMKISKGAISMGLMFLASGITMLANWFEVKDAIEDCKETYREELEAIVIEREERTKAS